MGRCQERVSESGYSPGVALDWLHVVISAQMTYGNHIDTGRFNWRVLYWFGRRSQTVASTQLQTSLKSSFLQNRAFRVQRRCQGFEEKMRLCGDCRWSRTAYRVRIDLPNCIYHWSELFVDKISYWRALRMLFVIRFGSCRQPRWATCTFSPFRTFGTHSEFCVKNLVELVCNMWLWMMLSGVTWCPLQDHLVPLQSSLYVRRIYYYA